MILNENHKPFVANISNFATKAKIYLAIQASIFFLLIKKVIILTKY